MLSATFFKLIAGIVVICACGITKSSATSSSRQRILQQQLHKQQNGQHEIIPYFESPEHAAIGDQNVLKFPKTTISGLDFNYTVKETNLSFGDVIALAGDFYAAWQLTACAPSISDDWDTSRNSSLKVASDNVDFLRTDSGNKLSCILPLIKSQRDKVLEARKNGSDVAQAYRDIEKSYNLNYELCTAGYAIIALCNPDHFGRDAETAYTAVHTLALDKALEAHQNQNESTLKEAYFIDGYAQHFLTDCFSAGHIRTPRRILHSTSFDLTLMPGDQCSKKQHDEDSASGLWVTNTEGHSWAAYGDKFLLQGRSARNLYMLNEATQASLDEVWHVFTSGKAPRVSDFAARRKIPLPEEALGIRNFVPLFELNLEDNNTMMFRQNIDHRAVSTKREKIAVKQDNAAWQKFLTKIEDSGSIKSLYTFTKSFTSKQEFLHIGKIDPNSSKLVMNKYGLVDAGQFGSNWGLNYQGVIDMPQANSEVVWTDIRSLGDNIYALVGKQTRESEDSYALHMGFRTSQTLSGQLLIEPLWSQTINDGNVFSTPGEVIYGNFDMHSNRRAMVKYFHGRRPDAQSGIDIWALDSDLIAPPSRLRSLPYPDVNLLLPHKIDRADSSSVVVGYGTVSPDTPSPGIWVFFSWESQYRVPKRWTFPESNATRPQMILSNPQSNQLIRIFYGNRYHQNHTIQIDLIQPKWNEGHTDLQLDDPIVNKYPITWNVSAEENYLTWFINDVDGNGTLDLVTYTTDQNNTDISVIVFPGLSDGTFGAPTVSNITLDPSIGHDLTAPFMRPIRTSQASYLYPDNGGETSSAIMSFFDNHGVLGTRIVAPLTHSGSLKYELKGQDPAIAGQRSTTLGVRKGDWMGMNGRSVAVGIVSSSSSSSSDSR